LPRRLGSRRPCCGSRCCTTTKVMPVFGGKCRNRSMAASNPPADPPMPTIGQLKFGFGDRELALAFADLARDDFLPFVFLREEDALDDGFCFPAMGRVYVSLSLAITQ